MEWNPIETAPKDGTRILLKVACLGWDSKTCLRVLVGYKAVEGYWGKGIESKDGWREWCGSENTHTTSIPTPIKWSFLPEGQEDAQ